MSCMSTKETNCILQAFSPFIIGAGVTFAAVGWSYMIMKEPEEADSEKHL